MKAGGWKWNIEGVIKLWETSEDGEKGHQFSAIRGEVLGIT